MSSQGALDDSAVNATSPSISPSPEPADHASSTNGRPNDKSKKRASADDGSEPPHKVTKRRAARACVSCRARKVRCDVVEGAPCGNCRWDNVEVRSLWHKCFASLRVIQHLITPRVWLTFCFSSFSALFRRAAGESEFSHLLQCNPFSPVYLHPIHIHTTIPSLSQTATELLRSCPRLCDSQRISAPTLRT